MYKKLSAGWKVQRARRDIQCWRLIMSVNVGAARKIPPNWSPEKNNMSFFQLF